MRQFVVLVYAGSTPVGHPASFGAFELALGFLILGEEAQTACEDALIYSLESSCSKCPDPSPFCGWIAKIEPGSSGRSRGFLSKG